MNRGILIEKNINCIAELGYKGWRDVAIYLYGVGVVSMGELLPHYSYCRDIDHPDIAFFNSQKNAIGVRLYLMSDGDIAIVSHRREVLARIGKFCSPVNGPKVFCDTYYLRQN